VSGAAQASGATFGKTAVGGTSSGTGGFTANAKRCTTFSLGAWGDVSKLTLYTGGAPGFTPSQAVKGVIYATSGGAPTTRKAVSNELTVNAGDAMAWRTLTLPSTVRLAPGTYCLGTLAGPTTGVADFRYDSVPGSWYMNADTYSDGATDPFGTAQTGDLQMSIYATYTPVCDKYASVLGADSNSGTSASPYRTVLKLSNSLAAGQAGCLKPDGTFVEKFSIATGGITLRSDPASANRATIRGRVEIKDVANDVSIDNVVINGDNADLGMEVGIQVFGDRFHLSNSDVTANDSATASSCMILGSSQYGLAYDTLIERNRIHDCGRHSVPFDHAIYMQAPRRAIIRNNYIYDNDGGWALHLYSDADSSTIQNNTIDGNWGGIVFSAQDANSSDLNTAQNNIVSNSYGTGRYNVESWWNQAMPHGNTVTGICVWNGQSGDYDSGQGTAYTVTGSIHADPLYVNRAGKDFRLQSGSPCVGKGVQ
jgi:parallel beta-helix repeat protein